jgi:hypothetical protein
MHRRPKLLEAIEVLQTISVHNEDAQSALADYNNLMANGEIFTASRMVVDIVDHYYHLQGVANGS